MRQYGVACLALALLLCSGVGADDKKEDKEAAVKEEWKRLNGTWELAGVVREGEKMPAPKEKVTVTLKDGKYTVRQGGKVTGEGTAKIDPTTRPKSADLSPSSGEAKGKTVLAIYEAKGDTHRLCLAPPGKPRPKSFEAEKGSGHTLYTYKRVKPRD
jgi:uncharacterized protein (TIGR03067 family)